MTSFSVFVVEDEESVRYGIALALEGKYRVRAFPDAESAIAALGEGAPDLVLMDIGLPGMNGVEALKTMKGICPDLVGLVITAYEDVPTVVSAMKAGAFDYVLKPLHAETLEMHIVNALETVRLKKEVRDLQERYLRDNVPLFIGQSQAVREVMEFVEAVAKSPDTPVLIEGETGTGKELIAAAIHYRSPHFQGPIVSVNCAAIPRELIESEMFGYEKGAFSGASAGGKKGLVEQAADGTLFLDEVGDLSPEAQAKLLRFLEEGEFYRVGGTRVLTVSARVVSATNKDLRDLIGKGLFREDLYYRLAVVKVGIPSLNERREDILPIAHHYLVEFGRKFGKPVAGIARDAEEALTANQWKGNVRELKNVIERAVLMGKGRVVTLEDLGITRAGTAAVPGMSAPGSLSFPPMTLSGIDLDSLQDSFDRYYINEAMRLSGGNESRAASLLNINHHTFRYRRKKLDS
jgi:DNA-binding NtrC family response regulator